MHFYFKSCCQKSVWSEVRKVKPFFLYQTENHYSSSITTNTSNTFVHVLERAEIDMEGISLYFSSKTCNTMWHIMIAVKISQGSLYWKKTWWLVCVCSLCQVVWCTFLLRIHITRVNIIMIWLCGVVFDCFEWMRFCLIVLYEYMCVVVVWFFCCGYGKYQYIIDTFLCSYHNFFSHELIWWDVCIWYKTWNNVCTRFFLSLNYLLNSFPWFIIIYFKLQFRL